MPSLDLTEFTTAADVSVWLGTDTTSGPQPARDAIMKAADAVNGYLSQFPWVVLDATPITVAGIDFLPARYKTVRMAATMMAGRLARRRSSVTGVEAIGPDGVTPIVRFDPDIEKLLRIGAYAPIFVG